MTVTNDNQLENPTAGQADWDSALNANFTILERGYHLSAQAGIAINTGYVVWMNSGGFLFPFNPNSRDVYPYGLSYTAAASGESVQVILSGIVRSLAIHSPAVPGMDLFVSPTTPGIVVGSYSGANRRIGFGVSEQGLYFNPHGANQFLPEKLTIVTTILAVVGSNHLFSMDAGQFGWNRQTRMIGNSGNLTELKFFSGSARVGSERLYETVSGGVTTVGSFLDRAGWPYENTEASTISGLVFGLLRMSSASAVGSDTVAVGMIWDRSR
jgi:hypothetical protein